MKKTELPPIAPAVVEELIEQLRPYCVRLEIVGHLREGKAARKIELAYIPRTQQIRSGPFGFVTVSITDRKLDQMLDNCIVAKRPNAQGLFAWGEKNKLAVHVASQTPVDLFCRTERELQELLK